MATTVASKSNHQQVVVPVQPLVEQPPQAMANAAAEEYLRAAGWVEESRDWQGQSFWADPAGEGDISGKMEQTLTLPGKDGVDPMSVKQMVVPVAAWTYSLKDATSIQRARDKAVKAKLRVAVVPEGGM